MSEEELEQLSTEELRQKVETLEQKLTEQIQGAQA